MIEHRKGIFFTLGLMIAVPVITLVATGIQMMGAGGDEAIRASAV
ncbi:MAG TPA: cytochrome C552, partial [Achromobacter sp.]|nr:cytochrome C552 [Achromobacter sp.]